MDDTFLAVCENFLDQAKHCKKMGSPFYADLLVELAGLIERESAIGKVFSNWPGNPKHDAVALRFVAALHYLVITKQDARLAKIFPPVFEIEGVLRTFTLIETIQKYQNLILDYLNSPPQTNEVGRSMVLLGGFLEITKCFGQNIDIFEIGASAGLNLAFDHYYYQTDSWQWGDPTSTVHFKPNWVGTPPPLCAIKVHNRRACDISPINAVTQKNRLLSYVWPDQYERVKRTKGAIDQAAINVPEIDAMEATQWIEMQSNNLPKLRPRVFFHSIIWQYFTDAQQNSFKASMNQIGENANDSLPLIWLRLEPCENNQHAELQMTVWPNKTDYVLADSGYHGEWIKWYGV